jgi:hypothetical protein
MAYSSDFRRKVIALRFKRKKPKAKGYLKFEKKRL